jgi:hypothetical protein
MLGERIVHVAKRSGRDDAASESTKLEPHKTGGRELGHIEDAPGGER